jgi:hypothetical protein
MRRCDYSPPVRRSASIPQPEPIPMSSTSGGQVAKAAKLDKLLNRTKSHYGFRGVKGLPLEPYDSEFGIKSMSSQYSTQARGSTVT